MGDLDARGYVIVSSGGPAQCGAAQTGCETFARGTFEPASVCTRTCEAKGEEGPGAVVPTEPSCRAPLPGEPAGASPDGLVCTFSMISASTEAGRNFADYADCNVVRAQRPYYAAARPASNATDDPRLDDPQYMAELAWVTEQAEASACVCCHSSSKTPSGAAVWDTEAGPLWIDTVTDAALAMFGGYTDSTGFGFYAPEDNNGFDRSTTGLPTTDVPRLRAFVDVELRRRGLTEEEARAQPPFAPSFRELIEYEPEACDEGVGVDEEGTLPWTGGGARYPWIMAADARSPGAPPNWDLPDGTLWALRADFAGPPMSCGLRYGEVPPGAVQRVPSEDDAPASLVSGETYYLAAASDIAQPITRCLFEAP